MKRIVYFLVSLLGFTKLAAQDPADFVLPSIISDHAVMQRDAEGKALGVVSQCLGFEDCMVVGLPMIRFMYLLINISIGKLI